MNRCVLHIGMPKTGTSSIQDTLYFGLKDPRFSYYSAGEVNGSRMLWTLYAKEKLPFHLWRKNVENVQYARKKQVRYQRLLTRQLKSANLQNRTLILSGEDSWVWDEDQIKQFIELLSTEKTKAQVIAYIRPWKGFLESNFQQIIKGRTVFLQRDTRGTAPPPLKPNVPRKIDYQKTIETLDAHFGNENLILRKFDPKDFQDRCVVQDFCKQIGVSIAANSIRRSNDSIGLNAVRMLHAYKSFGQEETRMRELATWQHSQLTLALGDMPDTPFRLHSEMTNPIIEPYLTQIPWLEDRLGVSFQEDFEKHDNSPCIRTMEDFFRFEEPSLRWLATRTKCNMPISLHGEQTAKEVAKMIHILRHGLPPVMNTAMSIKRIGERAWIRWLYGR